MGDEEKSETTPAVEEEKDSLPSWMRYLPRTPWDATQIHQQLHVDEPINDIRKRKIRIKRIPDNRNSLRNCETKLENTLPRPSEASELEGENDPSSEQRPKRLRSLKYGSLSSIDEVSMLVSFCKVKKDL
jgi:hypothetical protein